MDAREHGDRQGEREAENSLDDRGLLERPPVGRVIAVLDAKGNAPDDEQRDEGGRRDQELQASAWGRMKHEIGGLRTEVEEEREAAERQDRRGELEYRPVGAGAVHDSRERDREPDREHEEPGREKEHA